MFRAYLAAMVLLLAAGVTCAAVSGTHLGLAAGLALMTLGGGGLSAGWMTRIGR